MLAAFVVLLLSLVVAIAATSRDRRPISVTRAAEAPPAAVDRTRVVAASHGRSPGVRAPAVAKVLGYTSYVQLAGHRRREVALTFDDGPGPYTAPILRVLRRLHAVATFFVIGRSARAYPHLVAEEVNAGCEVGDHTETHPPLAELTVDAQRAQITEAAQAIHAAGAPSPVLFRPPYGSFDNTTLEILHAARMLMVLWSADTEDYTRPGASRIRYAGISGGQPGAIILLHDGGGDRSETVAALPRIIERLRQRGFRLVTVSQLVTDDPPPTHQPPPHPLSGEL
jgi:peptidoglycan-N-acetylglucosamine deacetylase